MEKDRSAGATSAPSGNVDIESGRETISHWNMILDQGVVTKEIIEYEYEGEGTEEDPYVVEWIENDPRNPMTFSKMKKWIMALAVANSVLVVSFCSSAFSGGVQQIMREFGVSQEIVTLGLSLFVLGFALGPLLWAPFSELYGRQLIFVVTYTAFMAFNAGVAGAPNIQALLILRFFAAAFGSSPLTNAGGVIADLFTANERGLAMSIFSAAPFMGPVLGPIIGGFLGMTEGWRWVNGLMAIWAGVLLVITVCLVPETYPPVLLRKRAEKLSKLSGKVYRSRTDIDQGKVSLGEAFATGLKRPWILLFCEPIVLLLSLYHAIIYGILYMLFGAFPIVYRQGRGWNEGVGGLPFVSVAIGVILAIAYVIFVDNKQYMKKVQSSGTGFAAPEARLPMCIIGGIALPIGLFWFAWTNGPSVHWAVSVVAAIPFGFGMVLIFLSIMNYLIDSYTIFAASVLAGNGIIRSVFGAAFPLFTSQMYKGLGIHWASSVPAFLAVACLPLPFLFYKYGKGIREKCKYAAESEAFMNRIRNQQAARQEAGGSSSTSDRISRSDTLTPQEEVEEEAHVEESTATFEEMKAEKETEGEGLKKIQTGRSNRSRKSTRATEFYDNPYEINRVATRESFVARPAANSRASSIRGGNH
ncbi:ProP Permease of the major facilitator superfamily [Pyrenophora tritici-repentis]|uniref:Benomyl/methotrexate resistance protein n=2 Tax=Pyrenophora tritici-repentis TaxID=45151 RepID=A0A2W1HMY3_9PLEO|nr:benomyl/methotrexate resistance protein [Pyrenophora tritici-repentis Pt-1C-BFP]KAA8625528.1 Benomyl/methotrexate resistance protein [Pyrenophora tritici-repentis]EDU40340.1 benomyl/methotrexate resistance protein [Pyrenophora tritici-repentis Pt-1C-BFP]KAF7453932.1 Benomyl/methotrexate resistance protein [Pyrenophora tritici-repentis]KAF7577022.1 ProP, Permease major facilitator superfamily [Pyrenophora tritici-repentis]KAI0576856.1 Benomyl/methotrexate resistance protein [Pyrenophora trit